MIALMFETVFRIFLAAVLSLSLRLRADEVVVSAAASLKDALSQIGADYQSSAGDMVVFNFAGSNVLARQIKEGAPVDILFSAGEAPMDALQEAALIVPESRQSLLGNTLAIIVAREHGAVVREPRDLTGNSIRHVALADPQAVPAGIYARTFLEKVGLWKSIEPKVVPTQNVRAALAAVASGDAEAGIVYQTDAAISKAVKVAYHVPLKDVPDISYPVALLKNAPHADQARKFLQFLESASAKRIFKNFGFIVRN